MGHGGQKVRAGDREAQTSRRAVEVGQGKRHTSRHGELEAPYGWGREGLGEGVGSLVGGGDVLTAPLPGGVGVLVERKAIFER